MSKESSPKITIVRTVFILYTMLMLWLLLGRSQGDYTENYFAQLMDRIALKPFETIGNYFRVLRIGSLSQKRIAVINLVGNVILFVPFGLLLPGLFEKFRSFFPFFLGCLGAIVLVEITQILLLVGFLDIDDVILNMAGFCIGYGVYKLFLRIRRKASQ